MMAKFKVGDRVRVVEIEAGDHAKIGQVGEIKEDSRVPWVYFDDPTGYGSSIARFGIPEGFGDCLGEEQLELVSDHPIELVSDKPDTAERDQLARDILMEWMPLIGKDQAERYRAIASHAFYMAEAFLAERAKRTTEN